MELPGTTQGLMRGRERLLQALEDAGLARDVSSAILARHTLVRYPKGAPIFTPGSPADVIFVVLGGMVKLYRAGRPHERVLITLAGPGDILGYGDFSDPRGGRSQLFEAVALTGTTIAIVTREHLIRVLCGLEPGTLIALGELVNSLWAAALYRCARFLGMSLRARLEAVFDELAQRFGVPDARGLMLPLELGQEGLAGMIGGSRPMVSKLLIAMVQDGSITRLGRRFIVQHASPPPAAAHGRVTELPDFRIKTTAPEARHRGRASASGAKRNEQTSPRVAF
jgi:CRP/FNR family cyclic AMP-dependent transcriptional regulator